MFSTYNKKITVVRQNVENFGRLFNVDDDEIIYLIVCYYSLFFFENIVVYVEFNHELKAVINAYPVLNIKALLHYKMVQE